MAIYPMLWPLSPRTAVLRLDFFDFDDVDTFIVEIVLVDAAAAA